MSSKEVKRLKVLEKENRKLKQMYATLALDRPSNGKRDHRKKALKPCRKRAISKELAHYGISRACRVLNMSKSVYYYKALSKDDRAIEKALHHHVEQRPEEGFWNSYDRLRKDIHGTISEFTGFIKR